MAEHKIVLAFVPEGTEAAVAGALSQVFSLPEEVTVQIVQGAPIVILDALDPEQAKSVMEEMASVKQAGGNLAISAAAGGSMGTVNWPEPPTIAGQPLEAYRPGYLPQEAEPVPQPMSPEEAAALAGMQAPEAPATPAAAPAAGAPPPGAIAVLCPHCGGTIDVQFSAGRPPSGGGQVPAPGSGEFPAALPEVPDVPGQAAPQRPPSGPAVRAGPMDLEEFEKSVGGGQAQSQPTGDDLLRQLDASLEAESQDPGLRALEAGAPVAPPPQPQPPQPPQPQPPRQPPPQQQPRRKAARPGSQRGRTPGAGRAGGRRRDKRR